MKRIRLILPLAALAFVALFLWKRANAPGSGSGLVLYGNVELRQIDLAFNNAERVAEVLVQEGDRVHRGQVLARLETGRLLPIVAQAQAQAEAQAQVAMRLHNGSRQEEIAQAKAGVESAKADAANAQIKFDRLKVLLGKHVTSQEDYDNAKAALDVALARLSLNERALELSVAGPRKEEVAEADAKLRLAEAQLALSKRQLADAELAAPADAVVYTRTLEPGEMANPQQPAFALAVNDPKWVRTYVAETQLGRVRPGMEASVEVDSFIGRTFTGWVGFISPVAEFTPKTVQTEELRTSLVYEVRVFVKDAADELRLGMPATVRLSTGLTTDAGSAASGR